MLPPLSYVISMLREQWSTVKKYVIVHRYVNSNKKYNIFSLNVQVGLYKWKVGAYNQ